MPLDGSYRNSLMVVPFLKKRLRRITSIGVQNLTVTSWNFSVYFTLHHFNTNLAFFTSESLENERSPEWSNFEFPQSAQCLQEFQLRLWIKTDEICYLFLQYDIYLDDSIVPDVQKNFLSKGVNCLWLEMFGYRFTDTDHDQAIPLSLNSARLSFVKSYNRSSILRILNLTDAIRIERSLAAKYLREVEDVLEKKNDLLSKIAERESRQVRIKNLQQHISHRTVFFRQRWALQEEKRKLIEERRNLLNLYRSRLILQKESIDEIFGSVDQSRSDLNYLQQMIIHRRKGLLHEIFRDIYPINCQKANEYTIVNAKLPPANDKIFQGSSIRDKEIIAALGFSSHLILLISHVLHLPLRYPIDYYGEGAIRIYDFTLEVQQFLLDPSIDLNAFRYGLYLLNRNIGQMMHHCHIPTRRVDFRRTLENLKTLLEQYTSSDGQISNSIMLRSIESVSSQQQE